MPEPTNLLARDLRARALDVRAVLDDVADVAHEREHAEPL